MENKELLENVFAGAFLSMQNDVHQTAVDKGWHEEERNDGEVLCLIHSEVSEALEALRAGNPPDDKIPEFSGLEAELADVVIRIMDYAGKKNLRVAGAIIAKAQFNKGRDYKHGKRF
jgi:NTP pyrophosphatase (non-canonical NTP hydrolase)